MNLGFSLNFSGWRVLLDGFILKIFEKNKINFLYAKVLTFEKSRDF